MSIFSRQNPEPVVTGTDVLRQTVKARGKTPHALALITREIDGVGVGMLEDFASGKITLGADKLQALTKYFFHHHTEFDPELNLLRSIAPEPKLFAAFQPEPYDPSKPPRFQAQLPKPGAMTGFRGLRPPVKPLQRPGWAR